MPTSALGLLVFVLAVAPGLCTELILQRRKTRAKESAFVEVGRALLASVVMSFPAFWAALLAWHIVNPGASPDFALLVKSDAKYIGDHFEALAWSLAAYEGSSFIMAPLFAWGVEVADRLSDRLPRWITGGISDRHSAWSLAFKHPERKDHLAVTRIRMNSGVQWLGIVETYTSNHELVDRELILTGKISYLGPSSRTFKKTNFNAVVLKGSEIESIAVRYAEKSKNASDSIGQNDAIDAPQDVPSTPAMETAASVPE